MTLTEHLTSPLLPSVDVLSDGQVRGGDCVYCGVTLRPGDAVDLGVRNLRRDGALHWFPRACRSCADGGYIDVMLSAAFSACRELPPPDELTDLCLRLRHEICRRLPAVEDAAVRAGEGTLTGHSHQRVVDACADALNAMIDGPDDCPSSLVLGMRAAELGRRLRDLAPYPPCETS